VIDGTMLNYLLSRTRATIECIPSNANTTKNVIKTKESRKKNAIETKESRETPSVPCNPKCGQSPQRYHSCQCNNKSFPIRNPKVLMMSSKLLEDRGRQSSSFLNKRVKEVAISLVSLVLRLLHNATERLEAARAVISVADHNILCRAIPQLDRLHTNVHVDDELIFEVLLVLAADLEKRRHELITFCDVAPVDARQRGKRFDLSAHLLVLGALRAVGLLADHDIHADVGGVILLAFTKDFALLLADPELVHAAAALEDRVVGADEFDVAEGEVAMLELGEGDQLLVSNARVVEVAHVEHLQALPEGI